MKFTLFLIGIMLLSGAGDLSSSGCRVQGRNLAYRLMPNPETWTGGKDAPAYFVVTKKNWQTYYQALPSGADLSVNIYLVASWGLKPNPGYRLSVVGLREVGGLVQMAIDQQEPEKDNIYAQVMVVPALVAEVSKGSLPEGGRLVVQFMNQRGTQLARVEAGE